jgi:DNA polymerase-3 subunit epsilon
MKYLFFDTETTGLVQSRLPLSDPAQPHLVQLGLVQLDENLEVIQQASIIIKPDNFVIPKEASDVHGITQDKAEKYGVPIKTALSLFNQMCLQSDMLIAHNLKFDEMLMQIEANRYQVPDRMANLNKYCTMDASKSIVAIPPTDRMKAAGITDYKSPRLEEAYKFFTGKDLDGAHDALVDVLATIEVFKHLKHGNDNTLKPNNKSSLSP